MAEGHPPAAAMASYRRLRLPFARPQTLQTLQILKPSKPSNSSKSLPNSAGKRYPNKPNTRHARRQKPAMASCRRLRLPFARPQTLQTLQILQKSAQLRRQKVPQQAQHAPRPQAKAHHKATAMAQGHPPAAAMASIGVQGCRLPGLKRSKPSKSPPSSAGKRYPNKPNMRHSRTQKPPQGHSQKFAQLRREKVPQQAQHAPRPQAKATTRPQQWLKGTPRPQQWLLIGVLGCRLPGLKPSKPLQILQKSAQLRRQKVPQQAQHAPRPQAKATTRPQQWLKGTPRPQQWLLIGVQGCRLPGLKRSKPLQKSAQLRREKGTPTSPTRATPHHKATAMAEGHPPAAAMAIRASYRRSRLPFARPQTLQNPPKVRPALQGKGTPTSPTRATPARQSHHKATAMAEGHPTAAAMASYRRLRLPFARPQTLQTFQLLQKFAQLRREKVPQAFKAAVCQASNAPNPPKVRPAPQGKGTPTSPTRATPARKSHHKATAMAEGHPMASYRRLRLPFARPQTLQTFQLLQKFAQLRREKVPQQAQHAPRPQAKATTRPQQWLKGTPRPQQWLLIGV